MVSVYMVFRINFKTSFTSFFVTPMSSAVAPCEVFEGWMVVALSLLWSIRYLLEDGSCGRKELSQSFVRRFQLSRYHHVYLMCYMCLCVWCLLLHIAFAFAFLWIWNDIHPFLFAAMSFQISFSLLPLISFEY